MVHTLGLSRLDASATIRLAFAVLSLFLGVASGHLIQALPWLLAVIVLDLVVGSLDRMPISRQGLLDTVVLTLLCLSAAAAGAGYALVQLGAALLILIPAYHAGTRFGRVGYLLTGVVGSLVYLMVASSDIAGDSGLQVGLVAWLAAALVLGALGAWNQRLASEQGYEVSDPAAREAIQLIQRLHDLSEEMATGLDAPAGATLALDLLAAEVPSARSAVLVASDSEHLVPVALRGSTRAPWHLAEAMSDLLAQNSASWRPTEIPFADEMGRRSALVVPFAYGAGPTTVVVVERGVDHPFTPDERKAVSEVTRRLAPTVQAGLLFGNLRQYASLEERNRIARDIHDGIAQELAALGYGLDALRMQAGPPGQGMRDQLDALREQLSEAMADLRLHITDLRVAERPGTGLGAVLGAAVQSFGSMTGVRTTITVSEGRRRLDPRVEMFVHRLVMDVLADAQASGARNAWVSLTTSVVGPAVVDVSHDGDTRRARRSYRNTTLDELDGTLVVRNEPNGRTTVNLTVEEPSTAGALRAT
ncbi:sensor histidine kinase [Phycicoccus avicenniae]|uniref:sensor histidine kinase n=1 Tax=Phycicoccus avicenniae TaxID=2828860 RepID=UPI003D2900AD